MIMTTVLLLYHRSCIKQLMGRPCPRGGCNQIIDGGQPLQTANPMAFDAYVFPDEPFNCLC
jgi:hypothetical protein